MVSAFCPDGTRNGEQLTLLIRPENVRVHTSPTTALNVFQGTVEEIVFLGEYLDCRVRVNGQLLYTRQHPTLPVGHGDTVWVELPPELCSVLTETNGVSSPDALSGPVDDAVSGPSGSPERATPMT